METVVLDGVEYMKASAAAKKFGYTSDYVGQLCRGKKIDARLVGRSWFVNPDSIEDHKANKHKKGDKEVEKKTTTKAAPTKKQRVRVSSPLKNKTAKATLSVRKGEKDSLPVAINYEGDDETLLPKLRPVEVASKPAAQPAKLRVQHSDSKKIKIKRGAKKHTAFVAGDLPTVALSGKLKVSTYVDAELNPADEPDHEMAPAVVSPLKSAPAIKSNKNNTISDKRDMNVEAKSAQATSSAEELSEGVNFESAADTTESHSLHSNTAVNQKAGAVRFAPQSIRTVPKLQSPFLQFSPVIATVVALVCVAAIFSASSLVTSDTGNTDSRIIFQLANLQSFLDR